MSPPQDIGDQALIGAAQPSGSASRSTASDNAQCCGGTTNPWTPMDATQYWNGSAWASMTDLPTATMFGGGGGNHDDYIYAGGDRGGTNTATKDTFEWNGSAWSTGADTVENHDGGCAFGGNTSSAFIHSGHDGYNSAPFYKTWSGEWNGSSWTAGGSSVYGGQGRSGGGLPDDFIATGGYGFNGTGSLYDTYTCESYNGTSWTAEDDFPHDAAGNATAYSYGNASAGGRETYLAFANNASLTNNAFIYDGDSWTSAGTLAERITYGASGGDSSSAIIAGGADNGWDNDYCQTYNGTTFTSTGDLDQGGAAMAMGGNTV